MTAPELTTRILTALLRQQAATEEQLLAMLAAEQPTARENLVHRLQTLEEQHLLAPVDGWWLLTDDGSDVARVLPGGATALAPETPLTTTWAPTRSGDSFCTTTLALAFLRQHRAAFGDAPFEWEARPRLRATRPSGRTHELRPTAALRTFAYGRQALEPVHALVDAWPQEPEPTSIAERLCAYAELAAAGCRSPTTGPWRRWLGRAPVLLFVLPSSTAADAVADILHGLAEAEPLMRHLRDSVPIGVASSEAVRQEGAAAAVWWSPTSERKQVWHELYSGKESPLGVSCARRACHLRG